MGGRGAVSSTGKVSVAKSVNVIGLRDKAKQVSDRYKKEYDEYRKSLEATSGNLKNIPADKREKYDYLLGKFKGAELIYYRLKNNFYGGNVTFEDFLGSKMFEKSKKVDMKIAKNTDSFSKGWDEAFKQARKFSKGKK